MDCTERKFFMAYSVNYISHGAYSEASTIRRISSLNLFQRTCLVAERPSYRINASSTAYS